MKKKLMILVVVALFMTMMFSTGCKKKFDINGVWIITLNYVTPWSDTYSGTIVCTGSKTSGSVTYTIATWDIAIGTYSVNGKNVTLSVTWLNSNTSTFSGTSTDDNAISGNISETGGATGNWSATR